jgi:phospholipase/carboxylesterase
MQQSPDFDVIRGFQIEGTDPPHRALIPNIEPVKHLLVLLHGYGADADDLFPIARQLAPVLPGTAIVSLEAPEEIPGGMFGGRQWFPIARIDPAELDHGAQMARGYVTTALKGLKQRFELEWGDIALFGFSQGCMMSLEVGLRLPEPLAYVLGYSGALPAPDRALSEASSRPPFLLVHGEDDAVVPFSSMDEAAKTLAELGAPVETFVRPGLGHGIDGEGLQAALLKLRTAFGMGDLDA